MTEDPTTRSLATRPDDRPRFAVALAAVGVLLIVALLGLYRIADPFHGDQAIFLHFGRGLGEGEVLYVDLWDFKGPAVFWFYFLGGSVAGFSEVGVHLFEIGYHVAFGAALIVGLWGSLRNRALALLAPIATVGAYFATVGTWHLTQTEFLVAFPLFLALWFAAAPWGSVRTRRLALFAAGMCAGVVVSFKLVFGIIVVIGWLASLWTARDPLTATAVVRDRIVPAAAGAGLVLGGVALLLGTQGALDEAIWTLFLFPIAAAAEGSAAPLSRLARSAAWYAVAAAPWLLLAATAWVRWRGRRTEWLSVQAAAWIVGAAIVIFVQRFSWFEYHFLLFIVPVGLLAVRGADGLIAGARDAWRPAVAIVLGLILFATPPAMVLVRLASSGFEQLAVLAHLDDLDRIRDYQRRVSHEYDEILTTIAALDARGAKPGPIYVMGDPLNQLLWERDQAIPVMGWAWEYLLDSHWRDLAGQLAGATPAYVFVADEYLELITERSPETLDLLASAYDRVLATEYGVWYERRS